MRTAVSPVSARFQACEAPSLAWPPRVSPKSWRQDDLRLNRAFPGYDRLPPEEWPFKRSGESFPLTGLVPVVRVGFEARSWSNAMPRCGWTVPSGESSSGRSMVGECSPAYSCCPNFVEITGLRGGEKGREMKIDQVPVDGRKVIPGNVRHARALEECDPEAASVALLWKGFQQARGQFFPNVTFRDSCEECPG